MATNLSGKIKSSDRISLKPSDRLRMNPSDPLGIGTARRSTGDQSCNLTDPSSKSPGMQPSGVVGGKDLGHPDQIAGSLAPPIRSGLAADLGALPTNRVDPCCASDQASVSEPHPTIESLVTTIRTLHTRGLALASKTRKLDRERIRLAQESGALLIQLKDLCPHGKWESHVEGDCGIKPRTARDYMTLAENRDFVDELIAPNRRPAADLRIKCILKEISKSKRKGNATGQPGAIQAVGPVDPGRPMTLDRFRDDPVGVANESPAHARESVGNDPARSTPAGGETFAADHDPKIQTASDQPEDIPAGPPILDADVDDHDPALVDGKVKAPDEGSEQGGPIAGARSAGSEGLSEDAIASLEQFRALLHRPLDFIRQTRRGAISDPWKFRVLWADSRALREQVVRVLTAEHFSSVSDCERCKASGLVAPDKRCKACAGVGLVIVQQPDLPTDESCESEGCAAR